MPDQISHSEKSFVTALLLCIILGALGVTQLLRWKDLDRNPGAANEWWVGYMDSYRHDCDHHPTFQGQ